MNMEGSPHTIPFSARTSIEKKSKQSSQHILLHQANLQWYPFIHCKTILLVKTVIKKIQLCMKLFLTVDIYVQ